MISSSESGELALPVEAPPPTKAVPKEVNTMLGKLKNIFSGTSTIKSSDSGTILQPIGWRQKILTAVIILALAAFVSTYVIFPAVFYSSAHVRRLAIFRHEAHDQRIGYMDKPEDHGMPCTNLLYYNMSDGARIGVWEMALPENNCEMYKGKKPIMIFLHGNSGTRSTNARKDKYRLFRSLGLETVTLDYRGFGDSTGYPTAEHTVEDVYKVFSTIRKHRAAKDIIVWGHSLGTGIATMFAAKLNETPGALVLETPFDRIGNVLLYHRACFVLRALPWFKMLFVDRVNTHPETAFNSIDYAKMINVRLPIFILATEDDKTVPAVLAVSLYDGIVKHRGGNENTFIKVFDGKYGYGHMYIHESKETPKIIEQLLKVCCKSI